MPIFAHQRFRAFAGLILLGLAAFAVACTDEDVPSAAVAPTTDAPAFPLTVRDSAGTEVRLERMPERIISLSPGTTEILYAIGAGDRIAATDRFSNFPAEANATPKIEYTNPNPEAALAFRPDLVIMATRQQQQIAQFRNLGMTVFYAREPENLDGVYEHIAMFGQLTGHTADAVRVVADMRREIDAVTASIADVQQGPRAFYELDPTLFTAAPNTFIGSMLTLLKARNIAQGATVQFPQLTTEAVLAANPEVIFLAHPGTAESIGQRPGWSGVTAVTTRRIYSIDPDLVNRPGPRLAQGIRALGQALYPDRVK
jgi:iron complex transport system substrate-binding protein